MSQKLPAAEGFLTTEPAIRVGRQWRITGFSTDASAIEPVTLGVAGYLVKPFHASEVLAVVARAPGVSAA